MITFFLQVLLHNYCRSPEIQERVVSPAAPKEKKNRKKSAKINCNHRELFNDEINIDCGGENTGSIFLTLMRLRLGLVNEDIADRFGISPTLSSRIFTTWMRVLSKLLGHALITWLPEEAVLSNLPGVFIKAGYKRCRVMLDWTEVFIERPKSLINQACTWSEYKHHNAIKFLVGISPTGYITLRTVSKIGMYGLLHILTDSL